MVFTPCAGRRIFSNQYLHCVADASVTVQCKDCLAIHLQKARSMGLTVAEIEEAAWMGVAFGGCKAMMFWREQGKE